MVSGSGPEGRRVSPNGMPPVIRIGWPLQPSAINPRRFPEIAAAIARLAAKAHTALGQIKERQAMNAAESMTIDLSVRQHPGQALAVRVLVLDDLARHNGEGVTGEAACGTSPA